MKTVEIEWRRLLQDGATCKRCGDTGEVLRQMVDRLNTKCRPRGVAIVLKAVALDTQHIAESNQLLIDGKPLDPLQPHIVVRQNECPSRGELRGREACRTLEVVGQTHDVPRPWLIRQGVCHSAGCC